MAEPEPVPGVFTTTMQGGKGYELKPEIAAHLEPFWDRPIRGNVRVVASLEDAKWQTRMEGDPDEDRARRPGSGRGG